MSYKTYKFRGRQDPDIHKIKDMFLNANDMTKTELSRKSGVSMSTHGNWFRGKTRQPQNATIEATGRALGFRRQWVAYNGRKSP